MVEQGKDPVADLREITKLCFPPDTIPEATVMVLVGFDVKFAEPRVGPRSLSRKQQMMMKKPIQSLH